MVNWGSAKQCPLTDAEDSDQQFGLKVSPAQTVVTCGFHSITFEKISVLDSYFIHKHIIIKYRSSLI